MQSCHVLILRYSTFVLIMAPMFLATMFSTESYSWEERLLLLFKAVSLLKQLIVPFGVNMIDLEFEFADIFFPFSKCRAFTS